MGLMGMKLLFAAPRRRFLWTNDPKIVDFIYSKSIRIRGIKYI